MADTALKVGILACSGIGRLVSTVTRQAAYRAHELRPNETVLLSSGALTAAEPEHVALLHRYPFVVIDGCRPRCGSNIARQHNRQPAATIYLGDVLAETKIPLAGEKRRALGEQGNKFVQIVAQRIVEAVDRVIADEIVSTL